MAHIGNLSLNGLTKEDSLTIPRMSSSIPEKFLLRLSSLKSSTNFLRQFIPHYSEAVQNISRGFIIVHGYVLYVKGNAAFSFHLKDPL